MDENTFLLGVAFGLGIISIPSPKDIFFIKMCVLRRSLFRMAFFAVASDAVLIAVGTLLFGMTSGISAVDRKSTRLNSSHLVISYAVFCLKKKNRSPSEPPCSCSSTAGDFK